MPSTTELWDRIIAIWEVSDLPPMNKIVGCWELEVDEHWWIAVNGHQGPKDCSRDVSVPPYHAYIEWCGWPAGMVSPKDGIVAAGREANYPALLQALDAHLERRRQQAEDKEDDC